MIDDSVPWRGDLGRTAARLRSRLDQRRWQERTFYLVERDLMVGFYAVRRLIESQKTSSRLSSRRIPVRVCPLTGKEPKALDRWSPWEHYDLDSRGRGEIDVRTLIHEFIHSFVLMLSFSEERALVGVLVGSDRTKKRHLYEVPMQSIIELFDHVAREDVVLATWRQPETSIRLSQHDLIDIGAAAYGDETMTWYVDRPDFDPANIEDVDGLDAAARAAILRMWEAR